MKKTFVLLTLVLSTALTACNRDKSSVGSSSPAPAPAPAPGPGEKPQDGTGDIPNGVREKPPGVREGQAPQGPNEDTPAARRARRRAQENQQRQQQEQPEQAQPGEEQGSAGDENVPSNPEDVSPQAPGGVVENPVQKPDVKPDEGGELAPPSETPQPPAAERRPVARPPVGQGSLPPKREKPNDTGAEEGQWYPPALYESPGRAWLRYNVEPMLKSIGPAAPRAKSLAKKQRITLALGYFDGFHKKALKYENENYGLNVAVDPFLRSVIHEVLTRDCGDDNLQLCGFEVRGGDNVETLYFRGGRGGLIQEIRVLSGAYSPYDDLNNGAKAAQQAARSEKAERAFSHAFQDSDLVVYVGHSRMGGGPDFRPPRLKNKDVDYPAYQKERAGARLIMHALRNPARQARALALMSCDSTDHFLGELRRSGPDMQISTVRRDVSAENLLASGLVNVDLFMRQGHLAGLEAFVAHVPLLSSHLKLSAASK